MFGNQLLVIEHEMIVICRIDHGVSVVQKITNKKPLKNISISDFKKLSFKNFYENHKEYMRPISFSEFKDKY